MYKELTKANLKKQTARIEQTLWTKSDILVFGKMLNSYRFSSNERKDQIMELYGNLKDSYKITSEQSQFGIDWLNKLCFTSKGKNRNTKMLEDFMERDFNIVRNFSRFEFVGFNENYNGSYSSYYSPIYRTIDKEGNYFEYTMSGGHWGKPEIVGRGKVEYKTKLALAL